MDAKRLDEHCKRLADDEHNLQRALSVLWLGISSGNAVSKETLDLIKRRLQQTRRNLDILEQELAIAVWPRTGGSGNSNLNPEDTISDDGFETYAAD